MFSAKTSNVDRIGWSKKDGKQSSIESSLKLIRDVRLDYSGPTEFGDGQEGKDAELPLFSFDVIASATSNFSDSNKLGKGGFGDVYKVQTGRDTQTQTQ